MLALTCLAMLAFVWPSSQASEPTALSVMESMFARMDSLRTLQFYLVNWERIEGKLMSGEQRVWLQTRPFQCYIYMIAPQRGAELLYAGPKTGGEAIYNPKGFPYMKINLDPMGETIRKNNHHTIFELGFQYLSDILRDLNNRNMLNVELEGVREVAGRNCTVIKATVPSFKTENHTVEKWETLVSIARKKNLSEYMLMEMNPDTDDYEDVEAGQVIRIPSAYAQSFELAIDNETRVPVEISVFDAKGLFEKYLYKNVRINPFIPPATFSETNLGRIK